MTTAQDIEQRATKWALQTSTIVGIATIIAAAIGGTADATTGLPVVSAFVGLLAGGAAAILLPGQDAAPIIAGAEAIAAQVATHAETAKGAAVEAKVAATAVAEVAPELAEHAAVLTAAAGQLVPAARTIVTLVGQNGSTGCSVEPKPTA